MHKKYNKFLIVSFILISLLGIYSYFYKDLKSEAATSDSSITSSLNGATPLSQVGSDGAITDTAFLMNLDSLKKIKIDTSLLESKPFKLLIDNNIKLEPVPYGRINPFAPTDNVVVNNVVNNNTPVASVKVNPPTQVTDKSAIVSGSLDGAKSNNVYFEYGLALTFGKTTPKVIPSLVGNFSYKIIGLSSKTTYFFRAAANINGVLTFSDTISFNTN